MIATAEDLFWRGEASVWTVRRLFILYKELSLHNVIVMKFCNQLCYQHKQHCKKWDQGLFIKTTSSSSRGKRIHATVWYWKNPMPSQFSRFSCNRAHLGRTESCCEKQSPPPQHRETTHSISHWWMACSSLRNNLYNHKIHAKSWSSLLHYIEEVIRVIEGVRIRETKLLSFVL